MHMYMGKMELGKTEQGKMEPKVLPLRSPTLVSKRDLH